MDDQKAQIKLSREQHRTADLSKKLSQENEDAVMHVKVHSPFKTYFDGVAQSISAVNATGPFDILPKHHNFMTLLTPCEVVIRTETNELRTKISRGVMHVKADQVIVFLDV